MYLEKSSFTSEQVYFKSVVEKEQENILMQYKAGGRFLAQNTPKNAVILCDRSIMYPLVAFNNKNNFFISNSSDTYSKALYNPKKYCDYLIISNTKSPFYFSDKVASNIKNLKENKEGISNYRSKVIYFSDAFKIVKILK